MPIHEAQTIAQIVTAPGKGAVGIIRISGDEALAIGDGLAGGRGMITRAASHTIHYGWVHDREGNRLDEALFMVMHGPRTYTGEDVVEVQCHGGPVAVGEVLREACARGARPAEAGEFSRRAFLNGKIDLSRAEAIMDLVEAKSDGALKLAARQKSGRTEELVDGLRAAILELIAYIQADLDFPEDDIDRLDKAAYRDRAEGLAHDLEDLVRTATRGRLYRDGITVALCGRANVGKSSLLNALTGRNTAIVTNIPGTTRDSVEANIQVDGLALRLIDTAGLRKTDDLVEQIGVDRAKDIVRGADVIAYCLAAPEGLQPVDRAFIEDHRDQVGLLVINQVDLSDMPTPDLPWPAVHTSALAGTGIDDLGRALKEAALAEAPAAENALYLTNARQVSLAETALQDLRQFLEALAMGVSDDLLVIDLQHAWEVLGLITGDTAADDLLDQIFSQFCLGK